jgi:hypothetical protein
MSLGLVVLSAGVATLAVGIAMYVLARRGRDAARTAAGLEVLQPLRWKEFALLVTQSFESRGFRIDDLQKRPGEDGVDYTLRRGNERHLLLIKHGGAYRVGPGPVRGLLSILPTHEAQGGILVTSGRFDAAAVESARGQPVTLVDGATLWNQLEPLLPTAMLDEADRRTTTAMARSAGRARAVGLLGIAVILGGGLLDFLDRGTPADNVDDIVAAAPASPAAPPPVTANPPPAQPSTTAPAPPAPELTEAELEQQRSFAAAEVLLVPGVASSRWESRSTLEVAVLAEADDERARIIDQVCARLLQREPLRFSRLKLVAFGAAAGATPRWHQCR